MRGIMAVIGVMTLLIFVAMGLLAYGIASHGPKHIQITGPAGVPPALALPAKASIKTMSAWKNGVALDVTTPDGEYIYFVDPEAPAFRMEVTRSK